MTEYRYHLLSNERQRDLKAWVTRLGFTPDEVCDRFTVADGEVRFRVYELDSDGHKRIVGDDIASHIVTAPLTDGPAWLHPQPTMS